MPCGHFGRLTQFPDVGNHRQKSEVYKIGMNELKRGALNALALTEPREDSNT